MTDASVQNEPLSRDRGVGLNLWLNLALAALVVALLAAVAYFGYSIYRDNQTDLASSAAGRLTATLQDQVRKNPNDAILRVRLGEALGGLGKYSQATEQFNAALKINPKHVGAYLDLGLVALAADDPEAAQSYFKKVLDLTDANKYSAIDQSRELALYNLGLINLEAKNYGDAAGYFKAALAMRKDASDTYYQLAQALKGLGETDGAIQQLEIGLQFDPSYAEAHFLLGELYKDKKDDVNASYQFVRAAELAPEADPPMEAVAAFGPVGGWIEKSRASLTAGDLDPAITSVLVARNLDAKSVEAAKLHAEILLKRSNLKDALDVYRQALVLDPENAEFKAQIAALEPQVAAQLKQEAAAKKKKSKK